MGGIDDLVARFMAAQVPRPEWTHTAHLTVGAWHVSQFGFDEALSRLRVGIRRLNESNGVENTATGGYHESITRAYAVLLDAFLRTFPPETSLALRVEAILQSALARRDVLLTFFRQETLMSVRAREEWVEPDLRPLGLAGLGPSSAPS